MTKKILIFEIFYCLHMLLLCLCCFIMGESPLGIWPSGARENSPHLAEVRIPSALPKQWVRVCSVDCYRQIKKKNHGRDSAWVSG